MITGQKEKQHPIDRLIFEMGTAVKVIMWAVGISGCLIFWYAAAVIFLGEGG